jgi:hypothetical protein
MTRTLTLALLLLSCAFAFSQNSAPHLHPQEQQPQKDAPIISFTLDFPGGTPPFYNIAIDSTGRAEYKSTPMPKNQGDPYDVKFTASEATRTRLFDLARQVDFFRGNFDYTKNKVAFTGNKTLDFRDGADMRHTTYNWSENPQIQSITTIFQNIEETLELGRQLEDKYRFDKLGVDGVLKDMEAECKDNRLAELQAIQPILSRIVKDSSMMNISRRRAEFLLSKVPGS